MESSLKAALCAVVLLVCSAPTPSFAAASTFCLYAMLTGAHQMTVRCGEPLKPADEKRFRDLLTAARENIIRNDRRSAATPEKTRANLDGYEARLAAQDAGASQAICKSKDHADARGLLENFTNPKQADLLLLGLRMGHDDPYKGDCL